MSIQFPNVMADVLATRRHLHQFPEIGLSEFKTSNYVAERLQALGYEVTRGWRRRGLSPHCAMATVREASVFAPISTRFRSWRKRGWTIASKVPGVMHACGHDGHTAMLLGQPGFWRNGETLTAPFT